MKLVKFIRSLNVEEVPCIDNQQVFQYFGYSWLPVSYSNKLIHTADAVRSKIVPIQEFFEYTETDLPGQSEVKETYIAISEEVEELLGKPYSAL